MLRGILLLIISSESLDPTTIDLLTPAREFGETCGYESCPVPQQGSLNVHIVPHTHGELGYTRTFYEHYTGHDTFYATSKINMKRILDYTITELWANENRKFTLSDTAYFFHWWSQRDGTVRRMVYQLLRQGRLFLVGGGWSMTDEATTSYHAIIDQYTYALRKINQTFLECGRPLVTWQSDVFGHSREFTSLVAQMGFDGHFINPISFDDELARMERNALEFVWRGSDELGPETDIYTHKLFDGYWSPPGFCFGGQCADPLFVTSDTMFKNVEERVNTFIKQVTHRQSPYYTTNNIMVILGQRLGYYDASIWFQNIDKLIDSVNIKGASTGNSIKLFYSTPACYLRAVHDANPPLQTKQDDFLPYSYDRSSYAVGMYTSRPSLKYLVREGHRYLQIIKQLQVTVRLRYDEKLFERFMWINGVVQDHNIITGALREHVKNYYTKKLHTAIQSSTLLINNAFNKLRRSPENTSYYRCVFNESSCFNSNSLEYFVVIYNPLAWNVTVPVRLPMFGYQYVVYHPSGLRLKASLMKTAEPITRLPTRRSKASFELVFIAEDVPPLGFRSYYLRHRNAGWKRDKRSIIKKINSKINKKKYLVRKDHPDEKVSEETTDDYSDTQTAKNKIIFSNIINKSNLNSKNNKDKYLVRQNNPGEKFDEETADYSDTQTAKNKIIFSNIINNSNIKKLNSKNNKDKYLVRQNSPGEKNDEETADYSDTQTAKNKIFSNIIKNKNIDVSNIATPKNSKYTTSLHVITANDRRKLVNIKNNDRIDEENDDASKDNDTFNDLNEAVTTSNDFKVTTEYDSRRNNYKIDEENDNISKDTFNDLNEEVTTPNDYKITTEYDNRKNNYKMYEENDYISMENDTFNDSNKGTTTPILLYDFKTTTEYDSTTFNDIEATTVKTRNRVITFVPIDDEISSVAPISKFESLDNVDDDVSNRKTLLKNETVNQVFDNNENIDTAFDRDVKKIEKNKILKKEGKESQFERAWKTYKFIESNDDFIRNRYIRITINKLGKIIHVGLSNGVNITLHIDFLLYASDEPSKFGRNDKNPGAYIFRPMDARPESIMDDFDTKIYKCKMVQEIHTRYSNYASIVVKLYRRSPVIEVDWLVGPIPVVDEIGKEVFIRYSTDLTNNGVFYTDSNGRQTIKRIRNRRASYDPVVPDPIPGNYYPVTSKIYIEDTNKNIRFAIFNDRAQGGTSLNDGQIDLMLHRRILTDDAGIQAILNETEAEQGTVVRGTHYLYFTKADYKPNKIFEKKFAKEVELKPIIMLSSEAPFGTKTKEKWFEQTNEFSAIKENIPLGVHILTIESWTDDTILLRLENYLEKNDAVKSGVKRVFLKKIFRNLNILKVKETTLAGNIWLDKWMPLHWTKKEKFLKNFNDAYGTGNIELDGDRLIKGFEEVNLDNGIVLVPQQIRTFVVNFEYVGDI